MPYILWDNIRRGAEIFCPHIERSCTAEYYSDRKLGVSETIRTAASTIHLFTGNNISLIRDLASRSLRIRVEAASSMPENRAFTHPDPVGWTEDHRAEILKALYTILLGNPSLDLPRDANMETRFKMWQRLIGSAIEYAAEAMGEEVDFAELFRKQDADADDNETTASLIEILMRLYRSNKFKADVVAKIINTDQMVDGDGDALRAILFPQLKDGVTITSDKVGRALRHYIGDKINIGGQDYELKRGRDEKGPAKDAWVYWIEGATGKPEAAPEHLVKKGGMGKSKDKRDNLRRR